MYYLSLMVLSEHRFYISPKVYNSSYELIQTAMKLNNFAIVTIKRNDYRIYFCVYEQS